MSMPEAAMAVPVKVAAARIGVGERWLADQARAGLVPARRFGRRWFFTNDDMLAIVEAARRGSAVEANPWGFSARSAGRRRRSA